MLAKVTALALAIVTVAAPVQLRLPVSGPAPTRIMLVGDSITQGSAGDYTWRYRLWRHLAESGTTIDFVGPRTDLADLLNRTYGNTQYAEPEFDQDHASRWGMAVSFPDTPISELTMDYQPDVIVETMGVNDLMWLDVTARQLIGKVRRFVEQARSARPGVDIVLTQLVQVWFPGVSDYNRRLDLLARSLDSPDQRVEVARAAWGFSAEKHTYDNAHPNAQGELLIAAAVADALARIGVGPAFSRPLPTLPLGPQVAPSVRAIPGNRSAVLIWSRPPGADREFLRVPGSTGRHLASFTGTAAIFRGLVNDRAYRFELQPAKGWALSQVRSEPFSVQPTGSVPARPDGVVASRMGTTLEVSWRPVSRADSYLVWYRPIGWRLGWAVLECSVAQARLTQLASQTRYQVAVQAVGDGVAGGRSASIRIRTGGVLRLAERVGAPINEAVH